MKIIEELLAGAKAQGACRKAGNIQNLDQLVELYLSPQGLEFCINNNYPSPEQWQAIKEGWGETELAKRKVYINDPHLVNDANPGSIILVGEKTEAYITASGADRIQTIIALHGAKAHVTGREYSVLNLIEASGGTIEYHIDKTCIKL